MSLTSVYKRVRVRTRSGKRYTGWVLTFSPRGDIDDQLGREEGVLRLYGTPESGDISHIVRVREVEAATILDIRPVEQ